MWWPLHTMRHALVALIASLFTGEVLASEDVTNGLPPPLDMEPFEDSDCIEDPRSEPLLELMDEMCNVLDIILLSPELDDGWARFRAWRDQQGPLLLSLIASIFTKPYCEPGKAASATATCLLFLADGHDQATLEKVTLCTEDITAMLSATAPFDRPLYETRLHMFLRSPWPAFRLLDALVRLFPAKQDPAELDLGRCLPHQDWYGQPLEFDWPWFKSSLLSALDSATADPELLSLQTQDGPLSEQYHARWLRIYKVPSFREAAAFSSAAFYKFRRAQWEAGCHPGIVAAYLMQIVVFSVRDTEAWLQRYVGAGWRLLNLLLPLQSLMRTDWPVFRVLHLGSLLRRHPVPWAPGAWDETGRRTGSAVHRAPSSPTRALQEQLRAEMNPANAVVYLTSVWGPFANFIKPFLSRWLALDLPHLILLALDASAFESCMQHRTSVISCIDAPQRFGVEAAVAKYFSLAVAAQCSSLAVWLDFDVYLARDPTAHLLELLAGSPSFVFASFLTSKSLNPAIMAARGSAETAATLHGYASWLYENPYILDHQGWDAFLLNREGDFGSGWDYKGRTINTSSSDGLELSFAPPGITATSNDGQPIYVMLGPDKFASGDGWIGDKSGLTAFHFWGTTETQQELFATFYPHESLGFPRSAEAILARYHRELVSRDPASVVARLQLPAHVTAISYAHGCCAQAIQRNKDSALAVGAHDARAYGLKDLEPEWVGRHQHILSQRKGAGWWLWKPYVVLRTLLDDAVPWHTGVVLWLDAGNVFVGDPQPLVRSGLMNSDVAALRLKCCIETDWTSRAALHRLQGTGFAIADRPQLGAYFLMFRKTSVTIEFVKDWLRLSEDPDILTDTDPEVSMKESPGYQRHMADQSVFSILFKQRGFQALPLEEGHKVVRLDRWRE